MQNLGKKTTGTIKQSNIHMVPTETGNLENENGQGKVMEHEKLAQSHGILWSWNFNTFAPTFYQICFFFGHQ